MTAPQTVKTNTDPATFVKIAQNPDKPTGWNDVTLSDGTVAKFAGVEERQENGTLVFRIALNTPDGQDTIDGPIVTPEIAVALEAAGEVLPPMHESVKVAPVDPAAPPATPAAPTPSTPTAAGDPLPDNHVAVHESIWDRLKSMAHRLETGAVVDIGRFGAEMKKLLHL